MLFDQFATGYWTNKDFKIVANFTCLSDCEIMDNENDSILKYCQWEFLPNTPTNHTIRKLYKWLFVKKITFLHSEEGLTLETSAF